MSYRDLNAEKVREYVSERTRLFERGSVLNVRELERNEIDGDGYVNHVYRVSDDKGHSVIVKQAKPYLKLFGEGAYTLPVDRNSSETDIMKIRYAIVPRYVPQLLHSDKPNNLYICEDCGHLDIMRFGLSRGRRYPHFPAMMGEFIAKCSFYTSEIYMDQQIHKKLGIRFTSPEMSRIMESILFTRETIFDGIEIAQTEHDPVHEMASEFFWSKRDVRVELIKLRDIYMKKQECLVHGDLHTSNTMINDCEMKIIDMEYTHMGPFSSDAGYLLGNLVYTYDTWFYHTEWTESERASYRDEVLGYIEGVFFRYFEVFAKCWESDAKEVFRPYPEYLAHIFDAFVKEVCGFMGSQIASRVASYAETRDFDAITDETSRNRARAMAIATAYSLIMKRETVSSPKDITNIIRETALSFREKIA